MDESRTSRAAALIAVIVLVTTACQPAPPKPSPTAGAQATDAAPPSKVVGDLALEACDPAGLLPCEHQAVVLVEPIAASGVSLTYSTEWADGRLDRPSWNAAALGLGGWTLDVLQRYDPDRRILLSGDGSWRFADAVDIGNGEKAVPTYDGYQYFVFDGNWRHVRTVASITGDTILTIDYDEIGRLRDVRGRGSSGTLELTVERSPDGAISGLRGTGDTRTAAVIDGDGRLVAVGRPDGTLFLVSYERGGLVRDVQATGRGAASYAWDDAGRLARIQDADGVATELVFTSARGAVRVTVKDGNGGTATFGAERAGDVVHRTIVDAAGTTTQLDTNADGSTRLVAPDGTIRTIGASAHPRWGLAAPVRTPLVETRLDGTAYRVETTTTMGAGSPVPAGGAWTTDVVVDGQHTVDSYDPTSSTLTRTDPAGRASSWTFDSEGRVTAQRFPGRPDVAFTYLPSGLLGSTVVGEGAAAATTTYAYDTDLGQVVATRPDGSTVKLRLDPNGRFVSATTADENVALAYDPARDVLQLRPGAHAATSFGYSPAGRETAYIPPVVGDDAWYELTTYTAGGQIATMGQPDGARIELGYDAAGRATRWAFDRGTATATYDPDSGLLASNRSADGVATSFTYVGREPTGLAWSGPLDGRVERTVNGLLQQTAESVNGGEGFAFAYDAGGLLTSIDALTVSRDPDSGLPIRVAMGAAATACEFDTSGRIAACTTTAKGATVLVVRYARDLLGRVTRAERTDRTGAMSITSYGYDDTGRLSSVEAGGVTTRWTYDASGNRLTSSSDGQVPSKAAFDDRDRVVTAGNETFAWRPDGTLLERHDAKGRTTYEFDQLGALHAVALAGGRRVEYVVDAGGRRIGRKVDGKLLAGYLYGVDDSIVAMTDGAGKVVARFAYDDAGQLRLVRRDGRDILVVTDQVGSPIALVDAASGAVVGEAVYDAWGMPLSESISKLVPFGFAGGLVDPDTALVHFGARDYDPRTGRWTAPDPLRFTGGDLNLYRYAAGDPVNVVDPTGTVASAARSGADAPMNGAGRSGGSGSARGGGSTPYRDGGPTRAPSGGGGRAPGPRGPVDNPHGYNNWNNLAGPNLNMRQPRPGEGEEPSSPTHPTTVCVFGCYTPGEGADTRTPAAPTGCIGYCKGEGSRTICYGICTGGTPGKDEFACVIYCVYGEPHLATADGGRITFQAAGEFVIARSADGTFEVQARFEPSTAVPSVTRTTAVAMRIGPDRVAFYADPKRPLIINGEIAERSEYATTLPGGGVVERLGSDARVTWPDGSRLGIHVYGKFMDFWTAPSDGVGPTTTGVVGGRDGNRENDLATRDGVVLDAAAASFRDQLYGPFADSWRTSQQEALFDYRAGESTATFQRRDVPREYLTIESIEGQARRRAEALCRAMGVTSDPILSDCIFDVGLTGDPSYAGSAATVDAALDRAAVAPIDLGVALGPGQSVAGNLAAGLVSRYHFKASAGDIVYLDAGTPCDPDLSWRLLNPKGGIVRFERGCDDIGRLALDAAGEWRIEVYSDGGAAGAYAFKVITVPQPVEQPIAPGDSASGTTTAVGEWHRYTLQATAGQVVYLDATGGCDSALSWRLLAPGGGLTTFQAACTDIGRRVLTEAGPWVIEVYSDDLDTGSYAFRVVGAPAAREAVVQVGGTVNDATSQVAEWHRYRLTATEGQIVYLDALGACPSPMSWRLLRPEGTLTTFQTACTDLGRRVLDVAGDWTIEIYADALETGPYSFKVIGVPAVKTATIKLGQAVAGEIGAIGAWHRYELPARSGQQVVIDASSACVPNLWWRLLRPDGTLWTFASTCADSDVRTLDVNGTWVVEIYSDTMAVGSYAFTVRSGP